MYKFFKLSLPIGIAGIVLSLILYATNLYYEWVIPVFEKSMEDGPAFNAIDHLVYYTPVIFAAIFLTYLILGQVYLKRHNEKAEEIETDKTIVKNEAIQKALDEKAEFYRHKYYTNCPKCGAVREENKTVCSFCGAQLIIDSANDGKKKE